MTKFNNLVTKGLGNRRQTLAIWGLHISGGIEAVVGPGPGSPEHYEKYLNQQRTVWFKKEYKIRGCKEFKCISFLHIVGIKSTSLKTQFLVNGKLERKFQIQRRIEGKRSSNIFNTLTLEGTKYTHIRKITKIDGAKVTPSTITVNLTGKRDINPILVALDILD